VIVIGLPRYGPVAPEWLYAYDRLCKPPYRELSVARSPVHVARNLIVTETLRDYPAASHLLFLDDDVIPEPDALERLLAHDVPVVSGMYCERAAPHRPVAYRLGHDGEQERHVVLTRFCPGLQVVDAVGVGCLLVNLDVYRALEPSSWFDFADGLGEDLYFCRQLRRAGIPILLDGDVLCGHLTLAAVSLRDFQRYEQDGQITFDGPEIRALSQTPRPWRP
jgi:hypothetical protein